MEVGQAGTHPGHPPPQSSVPPRRRAAGITRRCTAPGPVISAGKGQCTIRGGSGVSPLQLCQQPASCESLL